MTVAVKKLKPSGSQDRNATFKKELEFLGSIRQHENVVRVFGMCLPEHTPDRTFWLVMEWCELGSVRSFLEHCPKVCRHKCSVVRLCDTHLPRGIAQPVNKDIALAILIQTCKGVKHLHSFGLIHRDIRADNVVVYSRDPLHVRITDFGLAVHMTSPKFGDEETTSDTTGPGGTWQI
jgi:serine/threonine protein kinase